MGLKVYVVVKPPQSNAIHLMKQTIAQILTQKIQKYNDKYINIFADPMQSTIAQILTQIHTTIRGQKRRSRVSLLLETGLQSS